MLSVCVLQERKQCFHQLGPVSIILRSFRGAFHFQQHSMTAFAKHVLRAKHSVRERMVFLILGPGTAFLTGADELIGVCAMVPLPNF